MKETVGDLIRSAKNGEFDVILHGCNCFKTFGAGIALQIAKAFPVAEKTDKSNDWHLGEISVAFDTKYNLNIVNCYTQIGFGKSKNYISQEHPIKGKIYDTQDNRYIAIRECLKQVNIMFENKKVGIPFIGSDLAGGDWKIIKKIIEQELTNVDLTIVKWEKNI